MPDNKLSGSIIGVQIGSKRLQCQAEAVLTLTTDTSEDALCKPDDVSESAIPFKTYTATSRGWNITVNGSLLKDSFTTLNDDVNLAKLFIDGAVNIDNVYFRTLPDQQFEDNDMIFNGAAILTNFAITAPVTGAVTTAATFQGNGALTYTFPPKTT